MAGFITHPGEAPVRPASPGASPGGTNAVLVAAILGSSMIFIDGTAVNVALPVLGRDLHAGRSGLQWVIEGYALFLSALILIGGSLGDLFGRRRVFGIGVLVFTLASVACATAQSIEMLVIARCVQGIGGALATPGSLALISARFSDAARGRAIGTWSAFSVIVSALGPVLGGWLVQAVSWRAIFLINVPIAAIVLVILALRVTESRDPTAARHVDVPGAVLATTGLGALVFGLIALEGGRLTLGGIAPTAIGIILLVAFAFVERRERAPMIRLTLFASRPFTIANAYTFVLYAALGGSLYFVPFDLIDVQGDSPAAAGAALLPMTLIMFALSRFSGGLVARIGARIPLVVGAILVAAAFLAFAFVGVGRPYWVSVLPATILLGLGCAALVAPLTTLVMGAVETTHAGVASGINNAVSRTAGLIAIAVLGILLAGVFDAAVKHDVRSAPIAARTRAIVEGQLAQLAAGSAPQGIGDRGELTDVLRIVRAAYARGFSVVMIASALLAGIAALLALDSSLSMRSPIAGVTLADPSDPTVPAAGR